MIPTSSRHRSPRVWLAGLLAIFFLAVCAPIEESDNPWEFDQDEPPSDEVDEPETPEPNPQIPETDPSRDCPEFQSSDSDPDEFDFELYRYLACRRDPDESLVFSPALVRIALAEAAQNASSYQATHIAQLFGKEDLGEFVTYADNLREELLSRRPLPASTRQTSGRGFYEIDESDINVLQQALGVEFFSASCTDDCRWIPQNQRWTDRTFHHFPPSPEVTLNLTRSMILRAQTETAFESQPGTIPFTTATGEHLRYPNRRAELFHWVRTDEGHSIDWRPVGGQFAILLFRPHDHIPLEEVEGVFSQEHLSEWVQETSDSYFTLVHSLPTFHIEETIDLGEISGIEKVRTTTGIVIGADGVNNPNPIELNFTSIEVEESQIGFGPPVYAEHIWAPFLFVIYDRELEEILLLGRVARPF